MTETNQSARVILGLGCDRPLDSVHHFARQREQRGVTVFIVMMAIVMLTGAGTWAMYSAGMTDQASGYARASAQAIYTAELGLISGSALLSVPGYADSNFSTAQQSQRNGTSDSCWSSKGPDTTGTNVPFCKSMSMGNIDPIIEQETATFGTAYTLLDQVNQEGSLSPYASTHGAAIQGDFILEMTEPRPVTVAGESTNSGVYQRVTLTSYGLVRPRQGETGLCSAANNSSATMMGMRAHMIIGPLSSQ